MRKRTQTLMLAIAVICLLGVAAFAEVPTTTGTISKVTVYRGQALVTRTIKVDLPAGTSELIVSDLPARIVPESLYAQTSGDVKILSVRYRQKAVKEDTREEVKELDEQIEAIENQIRRAERNHKHGGKLWAKYDGLWKLAIDGEKVDLNHGLLQAEQIQSLAQYLEAKWNELHKNSLEIEDHIAELKKELELLNRKRRELDTSRSRTEREAMLFISKPDKKRATIELSYLVNNANWQQQYNLRANPQKESVLIEYNAVVNQTSGEDWDGVALSLSTAEPTMVAEPPVLEPMLVGLSRLDRALQQEQQRSFMARDNIIRQQKARKANIRMGNWANDDLNTLALTNQAFVFNASGIQVQEFQEQMTEITRIEGISVTYDLPGKLSLPSRSDQQLVTIAAITAKADFTLVAAPLLTDYVYLQAELLNDSDTILLPGEASMFRNGGFVGKSRLPQVTTGEKFTTGFGIDSQVQVAHELEDKKTRVQGGNRIDTYHYRIALSNYKNTPVKLRLLDRLPYADTDSIKVELEKTQPALSKDSEYLRTSRKKGILRWDLDLEPNTAEGDATIVKYTYTMEYDRNMQIQPRRSGQ
ncbi:MAG: mucoidy inhibitor MuiA family protein [Planctomycetota bacterium]